ncbi:MAG: NTP transferase domain-containing protein, partial [Actinomycetes bacterium]
MGATAIIQARMGSSRLPGKVLMPLAGHPMLWHVVQRVRETRGLDEVVVATPESPENDAIRAFCAGHRIAVFSGSEEDVLDRYFQAAVAFAADPVVRVTSDCPLVDPGLIGRLLDLFGVGDYEYAA